MPAGLSSTLIHFVPLLTTTFPCGQYFFFDLFMKPGNRGLPDDKDKRTERAQTTLNTLNLEDTRCGVPNLLGSPTRTGSDSAALSSLLRFRVPWAKSILRREEF
jgi:hypothetical protein